MVGDRLVIRVQQDNARLSAVINTLGDRYSGYLLTFIPDARGNRYCGPVVAVACALGVAVPGVQSCNSPKQAERSPALLFALAKSRGFEISSTPSCGLETYY
jgi:hypothetical protein